MRKSMVRILCFLMLLVCTLVEINQVLKFKHGDGGYVVKTFYEQEEDSVDVLILGSSHAFDDFNTGVLWDEYGMASYVLAGSFQPLWNTYYYLKEALKTQKPELIVLEGYMTTALWEYKEDTVVWNTYGLKWSSDRIEAVKTSVPEEQWREFLPEYVQYHARYKEISSADFLRYQEKPVYENWKGFWDNMTTTELETPDIFTWQSLNERRELFEKTEKYYRMIIELAQENNIPIIVVVSPYAGISGTDQALFNRAQDIAEEYGVEFINYNLCYQEIGIDCATDVADRAHLNFSGNRKFSAAVGKYLVEHYEISDRRGDSRYQSWQDNADYIRANREDQELRETADREAFLEKAQNDDYLFFISTKNCDIKDENVHKVLNTFGISYGGTNEIWQTGSNGVEWMSGEKETERYRRIDQHDVVLRRIWDEEVGEYVNQMFVDATIYNKVENGVNVIVYSKKTQNVVDSVGFDAENDYQLVR